MWRLGLLVVILSGAACSAPLGPSNVDCFVSPVVRVVTNADGSVTTFFGDPVRVPCRHSVGSDPRPIGVAVPRH